MQAGQYTPAGCGPTTIDVDNPELSQSAADRACQEVIAAFTQIIDTTWTAPPPPAPLLPWPRLAQIDRDWLLRQFGPRPVYKPRTAWCILHDTEHPGRCAPGPHLTTIAQAASAFFIEIVCVRHLGRAGMEWSCDPDAAAPQDQISRVSRVDVFADDEHAIQPQLTGVPVFDASDRGAMSRLLTLAGPAASKLPKS